MAENEKSAGESSAQAHAGKRIAIILSNYNMPEMADYLAEYIERNVRWPYELIVVDNGSDKMPPPKSTTIGLNPNLGANSAWQIGFRVCDRLEKKQGEPFFAYMLACTNVRFDEETDIVTPLAELLEANPRAVGINPAHTPESDTPWPDHFDTGTGAPRQVRFLEWTTGLYRADWMKRVGRIDPEFFYNWGLDVDLSAKARITGRTLWIHEGVLTTKQDSVGYKSGRFEMSVEDRRDRSHAEMDRIFIAKYGMDYDRLARIFRNRAPFFRMNKLRIRWWLRQLLGRRAA